MAFTDIIKGFNSRNFVRINLAGSQNVLTCQICGMTQRVLIQDEFIPYSVMIRSDKTGKEYTRLIKSNKKAIEHFANEHRNWHFININAGFMEDQLRKQKQKENPPM
jgi:hypothetical protein